MKVVFLVCFGLKFIKNYLNSFYEFFLLKNLNNVIFGKIISQLIFFTQNFATKKKFYFICFRAKFLPSILYQFLGLYHKENDFFFQGHFELLYHMEESHFNLNYFLTIKGVNNNVLYFLIFDGVIDHKNWNLEIFLYVSLLNLVRFFVAQL